MAASARGAAGRLVVDLGYGVSVAAAVLLAMAAVTAAGLSLTGAAGHGGLGSLTGLGVVLALGGTAELTLGAGGPAALGGGPGGEPAGGTGGGWLSVRPLGVSVAGAATLLAMLVLPVRAQRSPWAQRLRWQQWQRRQRMRPVGGRSFVLRAATSVITVALAVGAGVAAGLAEGAVTVPGPAGRELPVGFDAGPVRSAAGALGWGLVVLTLGWLASARLPGPGRLIRVRAAWRPALRAAVLLVAWGSLGLLAAGVLLAGLVPAGVSGGGTQPGGAPWAAAGLALLAAPNLLYGLVTLGLGAAWELRLDGPFGTVLQSVAGEQLRWDLGRVTGELGAPALLLTAFAGAVLVAGGVIAARSAPPAPVAPATGAWWRRTIRAAGWCGLTLAGLLVAGAAAVGGSLGLTVAMFDAALLDLELRTWPWLVAGLGLVGGAVAGIVGRLLVDGARWLSQPDPDRPDPDRPDPDSPDPSGPVRRRPGAGPPYARHR